MERILWTKSARVVALEFLKGPRSTSQAALAIWFEAGVALTRHHTGTGFWGICAAGTANAVFVGAVRNKVLILSGHTRVTVQLISFITHPTKAF